MLSTQKSALVYGIVLLISLFVFLGSLPFSFPFAKSYPVWIVLKGFSLQFLFAWFYVNRDESRKKAYLTIQLLLPVLILGTLAVFNFPKVGVGFLPVLLITSIGALSGYFAAQYKKGLVVYSSVYGTLVLTAYFYLPVFF